MIKITWEYLNGLIGQQPADQLVLFFRKKEGEACLN